MARRLRPALLGLGPLLGLLLRPVLPRALSVALAAGTSLKHATLQQWASKENLDAVYRGAADRGTARRSYQSRPPAHPRSSHPQLAVRYDDAACASIAGVPFVS
jgi:hypothetical protein